MKLMLQPLQMWWKMIGTQPPPLLRAAFTALCIDVNVVSSVPTSIWYGSGGGIGPDGFDCAKTSVVRAEL